MIGATVTADLEMMEGESERKKEEFFRKLFEQLIRNETHQKEQNSLLLEIYLSYSVYKTSDQLFKEFVEFIAYETNARFEFNMQSRREKPGYNDNKAFAIRRSTFRHISNHMKVLYIILRDSLTLEQQPFLEKYNYIMNKNSLDIVKYAAGSLKKEDFFWLASMKHSVKKGLYLNQICDAVVKASDLYSHNSNIGFELEKDEENHPIFTSIETNLRAQVNFENLTKEMKHDVILPTLKELFALDNPFCGRTKGALLIENAISPSAVVEKVHEGSLNVADISPTAVVTSPKQELEECIGMMRKKLTMLKIKETSQVSYLAPGIPVGDKTHRLQTSVSVADSTSDLQTSVSFLAGFLKEHKISAQRAKDFFIRKKEEVIAANKIRPGYQFTSFGEDDLIARGGDGDGQIRSYATNNEEKVLAAGFCTCIVHAIRLLCLCTTASDLKLQKVLKIMVMDMKTDPWDVEEVLLGLKLNPQFTTFQSLALSFAELIGQSTSYIGELSLNGIGSRDKLIEKVKDLYHSNTANEGKHLLFVSVSGTPAVNNKLVLPYVFHVQGRNYKGHPDGKLIDFASDSDNDTDNVTFQTVGMIYSNTESDKPASFTFRFITYSRCVKDGQYVLCQHIPLPNGETEELHIVSHSQQQRVEEKLLPPQTLPVVLQKTGQSLVGLILLRNNKQCGAEHPYLIPETIRSIPNPTNSGNSDECNLTCLHLQILNTNIWLDDVLVQAIAHIMFRLLLSNKGTVEVKICLRSSLDYDNLYVSIPGRGGKYTERGLKKWENMINSNHYIFYIVNVNNGHWICLCISMIHKLIFSMDSQNRKSVGKEKADNVIKVWQDLFKIELKWVHLQSPDQRDGNNCGVFTFLNAAFLLKSILEGSFSCDGPKDIGKWSARVFSQEEKASIRSCAKEVIYGDSDGALLLNWIN